MSQHVTDLTSAPEFLCPIVRRSRASAVATSWSTTCGSRIRDRNGGSSIADSVSYWLVVTIMADPLSCWHLAIFSFTLDIYCTSVHPRRGIPHMWLSLRFLLSFYPVKRFFFSSFFLLLLRVKGRGHTLLKALWDELWFVNMGYTNKNLIDWLIDIDIDVESYRSEVAVGRSNPENLLKKINKRQAQHAKIWQ